MPSWEGRPTTLFSKVISKFPCIPALVILPFALPLSELVKLGTFQPTWQTTHLLRWTINC